MQRVDLSSNKFWHSASNSYSLRLRHSDAWRISRILIGYRRVGVCVSPSQHLPAQEEVSGAWYGGCAGLAVDQLPHFGVPEHPFFDLDGAGVSAGVRGHVGYSTLFAKALELLPRQCAAIALCGPDDSAHDFVFSSGSVLWQAALIPSFFSSLPAIQLVPWGESDL